MHSDMNPLLAVIQFAWCLREWIARLSGVDEDVRRSGNLQGGRKWRFCEALKWKPDTDQVWGEEQGNEGECFGRMAHQQSLCPWPLQGIRTGCRWRPEVHEFSRHQARSLWRQLRPFASALPLVRQLPNVDSWWKHQVGPIPWGAMGVSPVLGSCVPSYDATCLRHSGREDVWFAAVMGRVASPFDRCAFREMAGQNIGFSSQWLLVDRPLEGWKGWQLVEFPHISQDLSRWTRASPFEDHQRKTVAVRAGQGKDSYAAAICRPVPPDPWEWEEHRETPTHARWDRPWAFLCLVNELLRTMGATSKAVSLLRWKVAISPPLVDPQQKGEKWQAENHSGFKRKMVGSAGLRIRDHHFQAAKKVDRRRQREEDLGWHPLWDLIVVLYGQDA